jgi:hypothetical protein
MRSLPLRFVFKHRGPLTKLGERTRFEMHLRLIKEVTGQKPRVRVRAVSQA